MSKASFIFGLIALVFGGLILWYAHNQESKAAASKSWPAVTAFVIESDYSRTHDDTYYRFEYEYQKGSKTYQGSRIIFGTITNEEIVFENAPSLDVATIVNAHPVRTQIEVFVNPEDPSEAVMFNNTLPTTGLMKYVFGYGAIAFGLVLLIGGRIKHVTGSGASTSALYRILMSVLAIGIGAGTIWCMNNIRAEARASQYWPTVSGVVTQSDWDGDFVDIAYRYSIDGETYTSDQLRIGIEMGKGIILEDGTRLRRRSLARSFPPGKELTVYVDPEDQTNAVLIPTADHETMIPRYFGYAFILMGFLVAFFGKDAVTPERKKTVRA